MLNFRCSYVSECDGGFRGLLVIDGSRWLPVVDSEVSGGAGYRWL